MRFRKLKLVIVYFTIIFTFIVCVVSQTLLYSYYSYHEELKYDVQEKQDEYDKLMVKINTVSSREKIMAENPQLEFRDNVYYLESYEEE